MRKKSITKTLFGAAGLISLIAIVVAGYRYHNDQPKAPRSSEQKTTVDIGGQRFTHWQTPRELPELSFQDEGGRTVTIADFRGRVVLLNVWATWCPPCRKEMPSLDRLNARRWGPAFEVVAVSIDRDPALVKSFYNETGIKTLRGYFDPDGRTTALLGVAGVPATLLIDANGREIGRAVGPAEWDSSQVEALIDESLKPPRRTTE